MEMTTSLALVCIALVSLSVHKVQSESANESGGKDMAYSFNFPFGSKPNRNRNPTSGAIPPANCIKCQTDVGSSCVNAVCCPELACVSGQCVPPGCGVLGSTCAFGANQCCPGFNLDCLLNPITSVGFLCQQCIPQTQVCNPNVLPGTVGSCCFGLQCVNNICNAVLG